MAKPRLFISHTSAEADFAQLLKHRIRKDFLGSVDIFVSSDGTTIEAGKPWLDELRGDSLVEGPHGEPATDDGVNQDHARQGRPPERAGLQAAEERVAAGERRRDDDVVDLLTAGEGLEPAVGRRVGDHQGTEAVRVLRALRGQVVHVDVAALAALHDDDLHAGHDRTGGVRAVRRRRDQAHGPVRRAARLVPARRFSDFGGSGGFSSSSTPVSLHLSMATPCGPNANAVTDAGDTTMRWKRSRCTPV